MKRVFSILFALALVLAFSLVATSPVAADAGYRMVDDDGLGWIDINTGAHDCDSTAMALVTTIQAGIAATPDGGTLFVCPGTYVETGQIVINKNLTIIGAGKTVTIIKPNQNTGSSGDPRGWFLVQAGKQFNLSDVTLDGAGWLVHQGIRSFGSGTIDDCIFKNIAYQASGNPYAGLAVVVMGNYNMTFSNNTFSNIGRIGMMAFGSGVTNAQIIGNTYTGKGAGDWLDYGIEIGGGATATITGNTITSCTGVATSDGSTSAGILVTTYYGAGTTATITGNTLTGNTEGIAVGYDAADTSVVTAHFNNIYGNTDGVDTTSTTVTTNATYNWWGADDGPSGAGPGSGDTVSANVLFVPWACQPTTGGEAYLTPSDGVIDDLAPVSVPPGAPAGIVFPYGMFTFKITGLSTGQEVTLTIELPGPVPVGTKWWKYHNNTWSPMDIGDDDGDNVITVALKDGRTPDDEDLIDGQITDQGGPGEPGAVGWETYPISKVRVLLPWIALLAAIMAGASLLVIRRRRAHS
jgi:hypothetical protein